MHEYHVDYRVVGTKIHLYDILKLQNRPKKPISVPENLSINILEHYYKILNPNPKMWDVGTKPLFCINLDNVEFAFYAYTYGFMPYVT